MRNVHMVDKVGVPTGNKVLVKIDGKGFDIKKTDGGILIVNAADNDAEASSHGYSLSEFMVRTGEVVAVPGVLTSGSYDWDTENELIVGDIAYWPIITFFDMQVVMDSDGFTYLLVDYHEIHLRERNGEIQPINGFYLFSGIIETEKALEYSVEKQSMWYSLKYKGNNVNYHEKDYNYDDGIWQVGDECFLSVPPFKLEGELSKRFEKQYFLAQKRHILMSRK